MVRRSSGLMESTSGAPPCDRFGFRPNGTCLSLASRLATCTPRGLVPQRATDSSATGLSPVLANFILRATSLLPRSASPESESGSRSNTASPKCSHDARAPLGVMLFGIAGQYFPYCGVLRPKKDHQSKNPNTPNTPNTPHRTNFVCYL